jgi:hypothetical protein
MSEVTGLPVNEVGLLRTVRGLAGIAGTARTSEVLAAVDRAGVMGPRAAQQTLIDLIAPWRRHLPLVRGDGNWGSQGGDPPADPEYTEVGLTGYGALALATEDGSVGPVPLGLIDGSWYRGGPQPPYDPRAMLRALRHRDAAGLVPTPPTGGRVSGNLIDLAAGRPARLTVSATVVIEHCEGGDRVVVTEVPYGVTIDDAVHELIRPRRGPIVDVCDHSSDRGVRVICPLQEGVDLEEACRWVLSTRSLSVAIDSILPAPIDRLIADWDAGDGSGLAALADLLHSDAAGSGDG